MVYVCTPSKAKQSVLKFAARLISVLHLKNQCYITITDNKLVMDFKDKEHRLTADLIFFYVSVKDVSYNLLLLIGSMLTTH